MLVRGGVTTVACTLGGLKLSDKISYDRQISHYRKLAANFGDKAKLSPNSAAPGKWYLPEWLDDETWQYIHKDKYSWNNSENKRERANFLKKYPKWEDFKKHCYDMAHGERYDICTPESGWCTECARNDGWGFEKERAKNN